MPETTQETPTTAPAATQLPPTAARRKRREKDEQNLHDYLDTLNADSPIKVDVFRLTPKTWNGRDIAGKLDTYDEPVSEEDIRDQYGGGKYKLTISMPNLQGSWEYYTSRQLKIAGDPLTAGLITNEEGRASAGGTEAPSAVTAAMKMAETIAEREAQRAERAEHRALNAPRNDDSMATRMMLDEMRALREESRIKDDRMMELMAKPDSSAAEMLLGKMVDGESARMSSLREQINSEMRQRNDMHRAEIDRLHQRYEDIAKRQEDAHVRELASLRQTHENSMMMLKTGYDAQLKAMEREITGLERQLGTSQTELVTLRAQKDRSPVETLRELSAMKEAMDGFTGAGEKEESGGTIERIISGVLGSSLAEGVATRLAHGPGAVGAQLPQQQQQQQAEPEVPINQPVRLPDGRVIMRRPNGQVVELRQKPRGHQPTGDQVQVSDDEIKQAVQFMESACDADADPAGFARTARNLIPSLASGPIAELLRAQGVDALLERVAKLKPGSQLLTQHGKNWTRKVADALLSTE